MSRFTKSKSTIFLYWSRVTVDTKGYTSLSSSLSLLLPSPCTSTATAINIIIVIIFIIIINISCKDRRSNSFHLRQSASASSTSSPFYQPHCFSLLLLSVFLSSKLATRVAEQETKLGNEQKSERKNVLRVVAVVSTRGQLFEHFWMARIRPVCTGGFRLFSYSSLHVAVQRSLLKSNNTAHNCWLSPST